MSCRVLSSNDYRINCSFAQHQSRIRGKQHTFGTDITTANRSACAILAHSEGVVKRVIDYIKGNEPDKQGYGFGNQLIIEHRDGCCTVYCHLLPNSIKVKAGEHVYKGQPIAYMGSTGNSTAAHLDFSVIRLSDGWTEGIDLLKDIDVKFKALDPELYLDGELPKEQKVIERVQAGSFEQPEYALRRYDKLSAEGYKPIIKYFAGHYRVQVGAYEDHQNAVNMLRKLQAAGYDCYITTEAGEDVSPAMLRSQCNEKLSI